MNKSILCGVSYFILVNTSIALELPQYWLCQGLSHQFIKEDGNDVEQYSGNDLVLLEIFSQRVHQFFSPAIAGAYVQCLNTQQTLIFQRENCQPKTNQKYFRQGTLNLQTGELLFTEYRKLKRREIFGQGQYQCQFIGHTYNFLPFNHAKQTD